MSTKVLIKDNAKNIQLSLTPEQQDDLSLISGKTVKKLCSREDQGFSLLVFPDSLDTYGDKIGDSTIIDIRGDVASTGNLMGFVGFARPCSAFIPGLTTKRMTTSCTICWRGFSP